MIALSKISAARDADKTKFQESPYGPGHLTRAERWNEVIRYAKSKQTGGK